MNERFLKLSRKVIWMIFAIVLFSVGSGCVLVLIKLINWFIKS